jgi:5-methyltetrahydrofolate--homocysteine methyltransferase
VEEDLRALYGGPLYYGNDAFDGLRFMEKIAGGPLAGAAGQPEGEGDPEALTGGDAKVRLAMEKEEGSAPGLGLGVSPSRHAPGVRRDVPIPVPPFWGTRVVDTIGLDQVFPYINEVALIRGQWQVRRGSMDEDGYRKLLDEKIYPELKRLKEKASSEHLLEPRVVYGYFPCHSSGDDLIIYDWDLTRERMRFTFPRQKGDRLLCLADYFAPVNSATVDVVALQLVTVGRVASEYSARLFAKNDYKEYLYFHGLSVETAEALAEFFHKRIRQELGIAVSDAPEIRRLFAQGYQGARYSFGYPACPNLGDQMKLFDLLDSARIGVRLTEEYSLDPEQSTNAIIVHHRQARYFTP